MNPNIVTRFPPSPTGLLHAGNYRTGIFNYLFARKHAGTFILRIEDTDRARSKKEYEENILETLKWLQFTHDAFYRQSDNVARHTELLQKLVNEDKAYISVETPTTQDQRSEVVRFRNPNIAVTFTDVIRGEITIDTTDLGDFIIGRSMTEPLYHFGVVVDDTDEGVTHIIRGEDHISNTPRQILLQRALGVTTPPTYAHLPLVLGSDKQKLSKRKGAKALTQYRDEGFIPEAIINYLALVGWHPEGDREVFDVAELIEIFDLTRVQKGAGIFDETKLRWFNHEHLKKLSDHEFTERLTAFAQTKHTPLSAGAGKVIPLLKERSQTLAEALEVLHSGEFAFLEDTVAYEPSLLLKGAKTDAATAKGHLQKVSELLTGIAAADFTAATTKEILFPYATEQGRSTVLWPLRVALSGKEKSPDPFIVSALIGKNKTLERIAQAMTVL